MKLDLKNEKRLLENKELEGKEVLFLKDKNKLGMIKVCDIENITYCSLKRECEFHLCDGTIFCIKKKFSDIEKIQEENKNFFKIERGTIINLACIQSLNFKECNIVFKSGSCIYLNKCKLKKLEDKLYIKYTGFSL